MPTPSPAKDTTGSGSQSSDEAASGTSGATAKGGVSQDSATRKASDYLAFMAFSRSGLIEQLEYEGFTTQEATAAVDSLATNYNEQAAKKAKDYLRTSAFSRSGLIEQLEYEGFTTQEATAAVDSLSTNYNEQAAKKAKDCLLYTSPSPRD